MPKRILVILGHPRNKSFCGALADSYIEGAQAAGAVVRHIKLADLKFNAVSGAEGKKLEPDLARAQDDIAWAQHIVFAYPSWWSTMPALLKGFLDRVLTPCFAFKFHTEHYWWERLLKGRTARLLVTVDSPVILHYLYFLAPGHTMMKRGILGFCGIRPVKASTFGAVVDSDDAQRKTWLLKARRLGYKDAR
jgi:putative NADPH-quinone reductase